MEESENADEGRRVLMSDSSTENENVEEDLGKIELELVLVRKRLFCLQAEKSEALGILKSARSGPSSQSDEEEPVGIDQEGNDTTGSRNVKQSLAPPTYTYDPRRLQRGAVWDSHCHLDLLANRLKRVGVRNGENLEVTLAKDGEGLKDKFGGCIANFCNPQSWSCGRGGREIVNELRKCMVQNRVFLAIGCHPRFADQLGDLELQRLEQLARGRNLVAIGECGLDLSNNNKLSLNVQRRAFAAQVSLALRLKVPLVLHIREAELEGRQLLQELNVPASWPMHRHCFTGKTSAFAVAT